MKILNNKLLKYSLFIIPLILAIIFFIQFIRTTTELNQLKIKYDKTVENYGKEVEGLVAQNNNLNTLLRTRKNDMPNNINLYNLDIERLKEKGLSNPVQDIVSDLTKHRELIPYEGILGGTMRFYDREIWILNKKWAFAYFEDGHYGGYLLLEYNVTDTGKIYWIKIASMKN